MSTTATAAIAANAAAQSAIAAQEAHEAKVIACRGSMRSYVDLNATVEQKQSYAECVTTLHPRELAGGDVILVKALIVAGIVGAIAGAWQGWKEADGIGSLFMFTFMGALMAPFALGCLALGWAAVKYLFS